MEVQMEMAMAMAEPSTSAMCAFLCPSFVGIFSGAGLCKLPA